MGIVNVTPDSFSDGGALDRWERAVAHGLKLAREGADLLDIGGESTRPGAPEVTAQEELDRVLPVIQVLAGETTIPMSVDTRKAEVAEAALGAGAHWVNDVSALEDPEMAEVVARHGAGIILMHMQGEPQTMQQTPDYRDVVEEVCGFLTDRAEIARRAGLDDSRIWLDPGIGFGKTLQHNLQLFRALDRIAGLGYPVVLGASRKRFIGALSGEPVKERLAGSLAAAGLGLNLRRSIVRVHDVAATRQYLLVRRALETGAPLPWEPSGLDQHEVLPMPRSRDER
jgi:dihydropteroate synthase